MKKKTVSFGQALTTINYKQSLNKLQLYAITCTRVLSSGPLEPPQQANGFELIAMTDQLKGEFVESHNRARSAVSPTAANMVAVEWDDEIQEVAERNAR